MTKIGITSGFSNPRGHSILGNRQIPGLGFGAKTKNENKVKKETERPVNNLPIDLKKAKTQKIRNTIDIGTVIAYATIVSTAIAIKAGRPKLLKILEKLKDNKNNVRIAREELEMGGKYLQGKCEKGGLLYRCFDKFGKLKNNSYELTNNQVYGFGTLVVMPLVILFSPFGKKDASKEDRMFTVLRQPVSFATLFTMQLTFDKIFKSLVKDLNDYKCLDEVKGKDGKELFFSQSRIKTVLSDMLKPYGKDHFYSFNQECLRDKINFKKELEILNDLINGEVKTFVHSRGKVAVPISGNHNKFNLKDFTTSISNLITKMGDEPNENSINNLKKLLKPYIERVPNFENTLNNMILANKRSRAVKEVSVIVANSLASQALGIMMLNVLYGKGMKKLAQLKQAKNKNSESVNGGAK